VRHQVGTWDVKRENKSPTIFLAHRTPTVSFYNSFLSPVTELLCTKLLVQGKADRSFYLPATLDCRKDVLHILEQWCGDSCLKS